MFALILFLVSGPIEGDAAFSRQIESVAEYRGIELDVPGCALALDCSKIGEVVWVRVRGAWLKMRVIDCGAKHDRAWLRKKNRVIDLPLWLWNILRLPHRPYPVTLQFTEPALRQK